MVNKTYNMYVTDSSTAFISFYNSCFTLGRYMAEVSQHCEIPLMKSPTVQ